MLSSKSERAPAVAGSFYPADPAQLAAAVDGYLGGCEIHAGPPKALVVPHAGYVYSGRSAGRAMAHLASIKAQIRRVVILAPNHKIPLKTIALCSHNAFKTPLGAVPVDRAAMAAVLKLPFCEINDPAHAEEHAIEVMLPFLQRILDEFSIVPLIVGEVPPEQAHEILRTLWGGPETLIIISSDLSHFLPYDEAQRQDLHTACAIEQLKGEAISRDGACGRHPLKGLIACARKRDLRLTRLDLCNSGDTAGDKSRVVGYGAWALEYAASARLPEGDRAILRHIAHRAVIEGAATGKPPQIDLATAPTALHTLRATFTTIHVDGAFRGCRGYIVPARPLITDVADNAFKSAFDDPRVKPLNLDEARRAKIGISILSHHRPIRCRSEAELRDLLSPDRDGLVLQDGDQRALFLPKVWEDLPDAREFVTRLKLKAGWSADYWSDSLQAFRFSAEYF